MKTAKRVKRGLARRNGVQSIEVGSLLLDALANSTGPLHLGELAGAASMASSKARRYLVSLLRCGLVEQDGTTGRYDLGPMSLHIGLSALNRRNAIRFGTEAVIELNQELDRTVLLSVWSERGPIIIAWYDSSETLICNLYVGSILPLLRSVSGRLFLSYLPRATTQGLLARELKSEFVQSQLKIRSERDAAKLIAEIRERRMSHTEELLVPGLSAVGAPVLDHEGRIVAVIAMVGMPGALEPTGPNSDGEAVRQKAEEVSRRLGFRALKPGSSLVEWLEARKAGTATAEPPALEQSRMGDRRAAK